jgi:fructokinase
MLPAFIAIGEAIVELLRETTGVGLDVPGTFVGPYPSGAPAIFADAAARLGVASGLIGCVGDDDFGRCVRARCARDGVDSTHVTTARGATTGTAFVTYMDDGSRRFLFHLADSAAGRLDPEALDPAYFARAQVVHITGSTLAINARCHAAAVRAARLGKEAGAWVSFDPNLRPELLGGRSVAEVCGPILDLADVILPSGPEAAMLAGAAPGDPPEAACRALLARGGVRLVVLKEGAAGSTAYVAGGHAPPLHVDSFPVVEVDPTGAGDCFAAALLAGLRGGLEVGVALRRANAAGALATTVRGPMEGIPSAEELARFLAERG